MIGGDEKEEKHANYYASLDSGLKRLKQRCSGGSGCMLNTRTEHVNTSAASRTELSCGRSMCMVSVPPSRTVTPSAVKAKLTTSSSSKVGLRDIVPTRDQSRLSPLFLKAPQILMRNNVINNSVPGWI